MFLLGGITVLTDHLVEILSVHMCPLSLRNLLSKRITAAQVVLLYRRESVFSCECNLFVSNNTLTFVRERHPKSCEDNTNLCVCND